MSRAPRRPPSLEASEGARKAAAAVLAVMSGIKTPAEASASINVGVNRYYQLEARALSAMVRALEPLPRGRRKRPEAEIERLVREKAKLERDASRFQALYRASQKALGLAPPAAKVSDLKAVSGKKPRRPRVRAKAVIAALTAASEPAVSAAGGSP